MIRKLNQYIFRLREHRTQIAFHPAETQWYNLIPT